MREMRYGESDREREIEGERARERAREIESERDGRWRKIGRERDRGR